MQQTWEAEDDIIIQSVSLISKRKNLAVDIVLEVGCMKFSSIFSFVVRQDWVGEVSEFLGVFQHTSR
jgi:hypothetical protein